MASRLCECRNCQQQYKDTESKAWFKGYCSQRCFHEKARALGFSQTEYDQARKEYKEGRTQYLTMVALSEYNVLKSAGEIGSVYITTETANRQDQATGGSSDDRKPGAL